MVWDRIFHYGAMTKKPAAAVKEKLRQKANLKNTTLRMFGYKKSIFLESNFIYHVLGKATPYGVVPQTIQLAENEYFKGAFGEDGSCLRYKTACTEDGKLTIWATPKTNIFILSTIKPASPEEYIHMSSSSESSGDDSIVKFDMSPRKNDFLRSRDLKSSSVYLEGVPLTFEGYMDFPIRRVIEKTEHLLKGFPRGANLDEFKDLENLPFILQTVVRNNRYEISPNDLETENPIFLSEFQKDRVKVSFTAQIDGNVSILSTKSISIKMFGLNRFRNEINHLAYSVGTPRQMEYLGFLKGLIHSYKEVIRDAQKQI